MASSERYLIDAGVSPAPGAVVVAHDTLLGRKVALRFLAAGAGDPARLEQVTREATALARLAHPNVLRVHDAGVRDGLPYVATELVEGTTLAAWRAQAAAAGTLDARAIARVTAAAARGLAAAHATGVHHGAFDAEHVLCAGDRVVVVGSALAGAAEADASDSEARAADGRALCATLYQLIHGSPPDVPLAPPPRSPALARLHRLAVRGLAPAAPPADLDRLAGELEGAARGRSRRLLWAGVAAAAVAGAFWGGGQLLANAERRCRAGAAAIDGAWNDERRVRLRQHYLGAGVDAAGWPALERLLDGYAGAWRAMYADTCAHSFGEQGASGRPSTQLFDLRIGCLDARRAALDSFAAALAGATAQQLIKAPSALLPEVADCGVAGRLQTRPLPSDPQARAEIARIQQLVARAAAEQDVGDLRKAEASATEALAAARQRDYEPLLAAALVRRASIGLEKDGSGALDETTGLDRAARLFEEAHAVAERGHDDRLRLEAAVELVLLQGRRQKFVEGERWAGRAEALLARMDNPPRDVVRLATSVGYLNKFRGRRPQALAACQRALAAAEQLVPANPGAVAKAQGGVCSANEDVRARIACARRSVELARAAYGPEHPDLAIAMAILAESMLLDPASHAEACPLLRKVMAIMERTLDPAHPNLITVMSELGQCLAEERQVPEAKRLYQQVVARKPGPADLGYALDALGFIELRFGDVAAAAQHMQAGLDSLLRAFEPSNGNVTYARANLAEALIHGGRTSEAQAVLQAGLDAARKAGEKSGQVADLRAQQGHALLEQERAPAALRAFEEALRMHAEVKTPDERLAYTYHGLGTALLAQGRIDAARARLDRAFALRPENTVVEGELRADIGFALARAMGARPGARERPRACDLAREAIAIYRGIRNVQSKLRAAERWSANQRCDVDA
jgi:eukaryotic-like serine/threonine-protein kinase